MRLYNNNLTKKTHIKAQTCILSFRM